MRRLGDLRQKIRIGARRVLGADADLEAGVASERDMVADAPQEPGAIAAQLVGEVLIRRRHGDVDQVRAETAAGGDVALVHAAPAAPDHQPRWQSERGDGADALALGLAHRRDADFEFGHTERRELARDRQLFIEAKSDPGRLFAVA